MRELAADDGGALEQRPLVRVEQVEPALEQRLHRGRHVVQHAGPRSPTYAKSCSAKSGLPAVTSTMR